MIIDMRLNKSIIDFNILPGLSPHGEQNSYKPAIKQLNQKHYTMKRIIYTMLLILGSSSLMFGQCYPDRHNTTWYDQWISCEASLNPNNSYGMSHWIMYDFGQKMEMKAMHIWNSNIPGKTDMGFKTVAIDYSNDGETWQELGNYTFEEATGMNIYEGFDMESFDSFTARYLLLTAIDNYGGDCYGLSEIRFTMDSTSNAINENVADNNCFAATVYPNPFRIQTTMSITVQCDKKTVWFVSDSYGRRVTAEMNLPTPTKQNITIDGSGWSAGIYYLTVKQDDKIRQLKLVKLDGK